MSVIDVYYDFSKARTTRGGGKMSGVEVWTVKFDDNDDPRARQFLAETAAGIPQENSSHPFYAWYWVRNVSARPRGGPFLWEVTVQYEGITLEGGGDPIDPANKPAIWSWPTSVTEEKIDRDINDVPITNSAGESPDPPMTKKFYDHVARVVFYRTSFDGFLASSYKGALNSDIWQGQAVNSVKCTEYSGEQFETPFGIRYRINMEFRSREWGWLRRVRDEGFRDITDLDADGKPEQFTDKNGVVLSEPTALDGLGGKLADGADPVWNYYDTNRKLPFSVFGL